MERLTDPISARCMAEGTFRLPKVPKTREEVFMIRYGKKPTYEELYIRLAAYEDTGLTPEEINELKYRIDSLDK